MCYRGEQTIELGPKAYGVIARYEDDAERSNWGGKSALLESIDFALYGRLNKDRRHSADEWITEGEDEGEVLVTFDDGRQASRFRKRGKATQVRFDGAKGDEADLAIARALGIDAEDALATSYFQQRRMARLVLADPSERMRYVAGWLRLEPLQKAEEIAGDLAGEIARKASELREQIARLDAASTGTREEIVAAADAARDAHADAVDALHEANLAAEENEHRRVASHARGEMHRIAEAGKALRADLDGRDGPVIQQFAKQALRVLEDAAAAETQARHHERRCAQVAHGKFDGKCPAAEGFECPAVREINARHTTAQISLDRATAASESAAKATREARAKHVEAARALTDYATVEGQVNELRAEYARHKVVAERETLPGEPGDLGSIRARVQAASTLVGEARAAMKAAARLLEEHDERAEKRKKLAAELDAAEQQVAVAREAAAIFGKGGAQRRVAEAALGEIEEGANAMLTECGIGLQVGVRWCREGAGLAKACDACGAAFPASARAKECARCGGARGPLLVNKLDIVLSDRSGAAEDLAGAAIQLAASAWLRAERESAWSTALIDEPFGQLDAANRRALSGHLAALLGSRYGFSQSLVIAHHSSVLEALPGRIEIVAGPGGSKVRVAA
jgi:DNA repair exonuclease SbcCD ATPase subunit